MKGNAVSDQWKLPVWRTIIAAYVFLFRNWREALRIGWLPVAAATMLGLLREYLPSGEGWPRVAVVVYGFAIWAAYAHIVAMTVVPWHRYILLNQRIRGGILAVALTVREGRYAVLSVAIMAIVTGMGWAGWFLAYSHGWFSGAEIVFVFVRLVTDLPFFAATFYLSAVLALALPAAAVDRDSSLSRALKLGYRNGWRFVSVVLAVSVPYYVYFHGGNYLPDSAFEGIWEIPWTVAGAGVFVFETLIAATALSLAYRALGGLRGSAVAPSVIPPSGGN